MNQKLCNWCDEPAEYKLHWPRFHHVDLACDWHRFSLGECYGIMVEAICAEVV